MPYPPLESFGRRIMICGPSNSGKSTLAAAIGRKLGVPAIHLDQLRHYPGSNWVMRPDPEFAALHTEALTAPEWVMDGNYSIHFSTRLALASGIILLGDNRFANLTRYFRRTLFERNRAGALSGNRDSIKWEMVHWIAVVGPRNVVRYRQTLRATGLPFLEIGGMRDLNRLYAAWNLTRG